MIYVLFYITHSDQTRRPTTRHVSSATFGIRDATPYVHVRLVVTGPTFSTPHQNIAIPRSRTKSRTLRQRLRALRCGLRELRSRHLRLPLLRCSARTIASYSFSTHFETDSLLSLEMCSYQKYVD